MEIVRKAVEINQQLEKREAETKLYQPNPNPAKAAIYFHPALLRPMPRSCISTLSKTTNLSIQPELCRDPDLQPNTFSFVLTTEVSHVQLV